MFKVTPSTWAISDLSCPLRAEAGGRHGDTRPTHESPPRPNKQSLLELLLLQPHKDKALSLSRWVGPSSPSNRFSFWENSFSSS